MHLVHRQVPSVTELRAKLVSYIATHRNDFKDLTRRRPRFGSDAFDEIPGYYDVFKGQKWFYLSATTVNSILGGTSDAREVKEALANEKLLAKAGKKYVVQRPIFRGGEGDQNCAWVHAFRTKILK